MIDSHPTLLKLTIKKKWFHMAKERIKKEDYRDLTPYWIARLMANKDLANPVFREFGGVLLANGRHFGDVPKCVLGLAGITIGEGKPEWGATPGKKYFIIKYK